MGRFRNEWKYVCNELELSLLESKLKGVLNPDVHSNSDNIYIVHSLYFDDYKDTCVKITEAGDFKRHKWRIRYYNNDMNTLRLEYKEKIYGKGLKKISMLTIDEYNALVSGNVEELIYKTHDELIKKFCCDIMTRLYKPKVIINYERIAYVEMFTNIRITFDRNISCSYELDKFLSNDYIKMPLQNKGKHIVEVKFDDILPSYIKNIVNVECGNRVSYSKYHEGRKMLEVLR